jgi:hypothetical protein
VNKLTTEIIKNMIVEHVRDNEDIIAKEFIPEEDMTDAMNAKNWKRMSKRKENENWIREFDCKPYDDQLRAIVFSDFSDTRIVNMVVQGE